MTDLERAAAFCERIGEWPEDLEYTPGFGWYIPCARIQAQTPCYILEGRLREWLQAKGWRVELHLPDNRSTHVFRVALRKTDHYVYGSQYEGDTLLSALLDAAEAVEKEGE